MTSRITKLIVLFLMVHIFIFFPASGWSTNNLPTGSFTVDFSNVKGDQALHPEYFITSNVEVTSTQTTTYSLLWRYDYSTNTLFLKKSKSTTTLIDKSLFNYPLKEESAESFSSTVKGVQIDFRNVNVEPTSNPEQVMMRNVIFTNFNSNTGRVDSTEVRNIVWQINYSNTTLEIVSSNLWSIADMPSKPTEVCNRPVNLADVSNPAYVVGDGTPASCTETALRNGVSAGGIITFNCGASPITIQITSEMKVTHDTIIDGADLITLDGGGRTRIFNMDTGNFTLTSPHLQVQRLTFTGGRARGTLGRLGFDLDGGGGVIYYYGGSVTVIDCVFYNNAAGEIGPDLAGGAVYGVGEGETIIVGSTIVGNRGANGAAVGALHTGLTIVNSTLTHNIATGYGTNYQDSQNVQQGHGGNGGAIVMDGDTRTLYLCGNTISHNTAGGLGGAIFRTGYQSEPTIIDQTTIDSNKVRVYANSSPASGTGGLYLQGNTVTITSSTISNNASHDFAGLRVIDHGPSAPGVANLTNVTITGNYTYPADPFTNRGIGAGLTIEGQTTGTVQNCTIVDNESQFATGIINVGTITVNNSIISNKADNIWVTANCSGSNYSSTTPPGNGGNNIQWANGQVDMDCTATGITRADPLMGTLANNGGFTKTVAPTPSSPAIGAGSNCPATDQRGVARPDPCTAGAYEAM